MQLRNLTCKSDTDDYYNPIDLNNIFNDDGILDEWIQEGEQPMLPPDDLSWLDESIRRSDENGGDGGDDEEDGDSGDDNGGNGSDNGDDDDGVMAVMAVMMKRLMVLVEANEVVL